jgi:hypothetical protein
MLPAKMARRLKNGGGKKRRGKRMGMRARATAVLAPGAGATVKKPFGSNGVAKGARALIRALNARIPIEPGLPRPVGPYTVVTTTTLESLTSRFVIIAPVMRKEENGMHWMASCGMRAIDMAAAVNGTNNTSTLPIPAPVELNSAAECVPSAISIQVMNGNALQTTSGMIAIGRVNQQLHLSEETASWEELGARFISYYSPRLCAAPKLALRGVRCSAYPLNMDEYASFARIKANHGVFSMGEGFTCGAFSPICIFQTQTPAIELSVMVHIKWRVRFDPLNPATASHTFHPHTPDGVWATAVKACSEAGHGVEDIAESIANAGEAVGKAAWAADMWDRAHTI